MGNRSFDQSAKEMYRVTFQVPAISGNYATETITFGKAQPGQSVQYFREVSALVEQAILAGAVVELWLPQVPDGTVSAEQEGPGTYWNTNVTPLSTQALGRWQISAWPGAQLRVKSGGVGGALTVSASGF
jgi:hypothetical protein